MAREERDATTAKNKADAARKVADAAEAAAVAEAEADVTYGGIEVVVAKKNKKTAKAGGKLNMLRAELSAVQAQQKLSKEKAKKRAAAADAAAEDGDGGDSGGEGPLQAAGMIEQDGAAWTDVIRTAAGESVRDDPDRLRKAIKRREKQKEKSAKAWKKRGKVLEKGTMARQIERLKNLKGKRTRGKAGAKENPAGGKK